MDSLYIELDTSSRTPMYEQIYLAVAERIRSGQIEAGTRLPSKRAMCAQLGVSRSVIENAADMLRAEGYITTRARSGCYVCRCEVLPSAEARPEPAVSSAPAAPVRYDYSTGDVDTSSFPYSSWARLFKETVYNGSELLCRGDGRGDWELRQALAVFLGETRGVRTDARSVVIGAGIEYLIDRLIRLFGEDTVFACENPGYSALYRSIPARTRLIGLDEAGLRTDELEKSGASVVLVTPSHQFPLGITMPVGRRTELLKWASAAPGRYIIEDDYDSEFRYGLGSIRSLQGLDAGGNAVIYMGTFSRGIASSIRAAYMVLPRELSDRYDELFGRAASTVSRFEQQTLARFISCGTYARHLRRMNNVYRAKRMALLSELAKNPHLRISGQDAGLHFLVHTGQSERDIAEKAEKEGLRLRYVGQYYLSRESMRDDGLLVVGYAGLDRGDIEGAAQALAKLTANA